MTPEDLAALKAFYTSTEIPQTLKYHESAFFNDLPKAIQADFYILQNYGYTNTFAGSYERLLNIKKMLEKGKLP